MNIIRTKVTELSSIPAMAYKMKLASGGSGIKIHRTDRDETAFAVIDKRTGEALPDARTDKDSFPPEAFEEAFELLTGLPFSSRGRVKVSISDATEADANELEIPEDAPADAKASCMVDSDEFIALTGMFTDINGKMNYTLMNKQFIQFASKSKTVSDMVGKKDSVEAILTHIIKNRAAYFAGKRDSLSDEDTQALIDTIEEIDPRSAFKELKLHIRKCLAK